MKSLYDYITEAKSSKDTIQDINKKNKNLLKKASKLSNFSFIIPTKDKYKYSPSGDKNRCETNSWNYVKKEADYADLMEEDTRYYPVAGYMFTESLTPVEHWWIYDSETNTHIERTPLSEIPYAYAGIIGKSDKLIDDILKSKKCFDVNFFKSGEAYQKYFK